MTVVQDASELNAGQQGTPIYRIVRPEVGMDRGWDDDDLNDLLEFAYTRNEDEWEHARRERYFSFMDQRSTRQKIARRKLIGWSLMHS